MKRNRSKDNAHCLPQYWMWASGQVHIQPAVPLGILPEVPTDRRTSGPQNQSACDDQDNKPCSYQEVKPNLSAQSPY